MLSTNSFKVLLAAGAMALVAGGANAATVVPTCDTLNFTTSTQCVSPVDTGGNANVDESDMNAGLGVFGLKGWDLLASIGSTSTAGDSQQSSPFLFSFTYDNDVKQSGTWSLNPAFTWGAGSYAFVIKGSTDNAAYLMNKAFTSGTWKVLDLLNNGGNNPDLSNVRLFGTAELAPVPVPAAGFLMIGALGGLAALRRRRRAA